MPTIPMAPVVFVAVATPMVDRSMPTRRLGRRSLSFVIPVAVATLMLDQDSPIASTLTLILQLAHSPTMTL